jgi:pimeloyl-ACP methyl ester carboxylesterase
MLRFALSTALTAEPPFSADDVMRGVSPDPARRGDAGHVWVEPEGTADCLRFYGTSPDAGSDNPLIFLSGDVIERGNHFENNIVISEHYRTLSPYLLQAEAESYAVALGRQFVMLARPGVHGSSGDHRQRRREREVALVDRALDRLKEAFGWSRLDIVGHSGGGHLVGMLMARRGDINHAVIASGNVAVRQRIQERGQQVDSTGYADSVDPIDVVSDVAQNPPLRIVVLTDPLDQVVSATVQTAYVDALRRVGVAVEQRYLTATDPRHHFLRFPALLAASALRPLQKS